MRVSPCCSPLPLSRRLPANPSWQWINPPDRNENNEVTHYRQINLVSDIAGAAEIQDTNLVNAWGISFSPASPFWISDNGTGKATIYTVTNDANGLPETTRATRVVSIPGNGGVTGQLFNTTTAFNGDAFIFVSTDGTISGWRGALGTKAEVLTNRNTAIYTGITIATNGTNLVLLLANFREGTIDEYDTNLNLVGQFADRHAPAGFAPCNVQNIAGSVMVTFAKFDAVHSRIATGRGRGLIDIFDTSAGTFHRFATGKSAGGNIREMDSPWGIVLAPSTFGSHADQLLVGNFDSGTIMSFDAEGKFHGLLQGSEECPVTIDGLWSLTFGSSAAAGVATDLYFTAGPAGEAHGLFGVLQKEIEIDDDDQSKQ